MLGKKHHISKNERIECELHVVDLTKRVQEIDGNSLVVKSTGTFPLKVPSSKLTWQWKITIFNREYIFKWSIFHCHVSLPEGSG